MPKFSIIIPVYNVEKYIKKCLDSVFSQTYKDFEVIVVNDGTKDKSMDIVKKYKVKIINQENQGLSEARNNGVKEAKGDYILFLDSDDYLNKDLLKELSKNVENDPDLIRFQVCDVIDEKIINYSEKEFYNKNGIESFELISKYHYVEPAWLYAIKRKYYIDNKFKFKKGAYHEDFGLIPLIIYKSKIVNSINYCGYNYVKRGGSIITDPSYEKKLKKVNDMLDHFVYLKQEIQKVNSNSSYIMSFIANSVIMSITELKNKDYKEYKKKLKDKKVFDYVLNDTLGRKVKKKFVKISPKIYYKIKGNN